jgi:hypothetical protein
MVSAVLGPVGIQAWLERADELERHFFDTPRRRVKQSGLAIADRLPLMGRALS